VSLVDDHARRTLYACALYQDGFDLTSVEALLDGHPVVDSVQQLLDRSLVTARAPRPKRRFALLESVRAYAREHLATNDAEALHDRHAETVLRGVDPLRDPSADALRNAWPDLRAIEKRGDLRGARASLALAPLRFARAPLREHLRVLARVSEVGDPLVSLHAAILRAEALPPSEGIPLLQDLEQPDLLRGEWLRARATLCRRGGDLVTASELLEGALSAFRSAGRERAEGMALRELGVVHLHAGRRAAAERAYRAAQKVLARNAYLAEEATVLTDLAVLLLDAEGDDEAVQLLKEAQARHRAAGDVRREAIVLSNLGVASHQGGRIDEAATYFEDALQVHRRVGNLRFEAFTMGSLAGVFQERGRLSRAQDLLEQSVSVFEALGDARWEGWARARLAAVHAAAGHEELARSGFEAARTLLAESDPRWWEPALVVLQSLLPGESLPSDVAPASSARIAQRLVVASRKTPATPEPMPTLIVAADAAWFQVGDARRDIARRRVLRRLLGHLATRRSDAPGEVVTREEMLDVGWPGEKMLPRAASSRIYVAVRTLRELGLREVLVTRGGGYLLHPGVPLAFAE
ncbi:MAG: tetratricopeptide repeat protein, partial [Myxococcota bacterium]